MLTTSVSTSSTHLLVCHVQMQGFSTVNSPPPQFNGWWPSSTSPKESKKGPFQGTVSLKQDLQLLLCDHPNHDFFVFARPKENYAFLPRYKNAFTWYPINNKSRFS